MEENIKRQKAYAIKKNGRKNRRLSSVPGTILHEMCKFGFSVTPRKRRARETVFMSLV
jgi:hypothetical protein